MRKLYTDVSLETPFMVSYNDVQTQACANDEDTVTIGSTTFIEITDSQGHKVKSTTPDKVGQLLLEPADMELYYFDGTAPMTMGVQVTDVVIPERYTLTISPTPSDATVTLTATGETQVGNSITADDGTTISYTVSASGYVTATGAYTLDGADHTESVVLEEEQQPSETIWYLTDDTLSVVGDEADMSSITTSYAYVPLWNDQILTENEHVERPEYELRATSEDDESGEGYQVYLDTDKGGVAERTPNGTVFYYTPLVVSDGNGVSHKVAYNRSGADAGNILYVQLKDYSSGTTVADKLYVGSDGEVSRLFMPSQGVTIPVTAISLTPYNPEELQG